MPWTLLASSGSRPRVAVAAVAVTTMMTTVATTVATTPTLSRFTTRILAVKTRMRCERVELPMLKLVTRVELPMLQPGPLAMHGIRLLWTRRTWLIVRVMLIGKDGAKLNELNSMLSMKLNLQPGPIAMPRLLEPEPLDRLMRPRVRLLMKRLELNASVSLKRLKQAGSVVKRIKQGSTHSMQTLLNAGVSQQRSQQHVMLQCCKSRLLLRRLKLQERALRPQLPWQWLAQRKEKQKRCVKQRWQHNQQ